MQQAGRHVRLFRNGRNQAVRIPREFELEENEAVIRKADLVNIFILVPLFGTFNFK